MPKQLLGMDSTCDEGGQGRLRHKNWIEKVLEQNCMSYPKFIQSLISPGFDLGEVTFKLLKEGRR